MKVFLRDISSLTEVKSVVPLFVDLRAETLRGVDEPKCIIENVPESLLLCFRMVSTQAIYRSIRKTLALSCVQRSQITFDLLPKATVVHK